MSIPYTESEVSIAGQQQSAGVGIALTASAWRGLYKVGGAAALMAGLIFRRNFGAEVSLFISQQPPSTVIDWFTLIGKNRLLGLIYLAVFDIIDYALLGLIFLALYIALRRTNPGAMLIATTLGIAGTAVYFASNNIFSMLFLSDQYAAATTEAQRSMLLAAGQAVLALNNPGAIFEGTGIYMSFFLLAAASLIVSVVMLRSNLFSRVTALIGILASALDLTYCLTFAIMPALSIFLLPPAGLFLTLWHILVGLRLFQLARLTSMSRG
jgi:hypothetical protein